MLCLSNSLLCCPSTCKYLQVLLVLPTPICVMQSRGCYLQFVFLCFFLQDRDSVALLLNAKSPNLDVTVIKQPQKKLILLPFISPTTLCNVELIQKFTVYLLCGREGRNEEAVGCRQPRKVTELHHSHHDDRNLNTRDSYSTQSFVFGFLVAA